MGFFSKIKDGTSQNQGINGKENAEGCKFLYQNRRGAF